MIWYVSLRPYLAPLAHIPQVITKDMNLALMRAFLELEVSAALRQMAPLMEPRPNGMPPLFYQHFWSVVDHDATSSVLF